MKTFSRFIIYCFFLFFSVHAFATYNASLLWTYSTSNPTNSDMNTECVSVVGPIVGFTSTGAVLTAGDGTGVGNTASCVDASGVHRATITLYAWCGSSFNGYTLTCSGTPPISCPSGFTADSTGTQCVQTSTGISMSPADAVCTSTENTTVSSGFYDVGTSPVSSIPAACSVPSGASSGCMAIYSGSLTSQALVAGVTHYFFKGSLSTVGGSGSSCSSSTVASALPSVPADTCPSGQVSGTINGQTVCVNGSGSPQPTSSPAPVDTSSSTTTTITNNANNTFTTTITNSSTGVSTTVVSPGQSSSPGSSTSTTTTPQSATSAFCQQNPDAAICSPFGVPPAADAIPSSSPSFSYTPITFSSSATCPAPFSIPISVPGFSTTLTIDTTPLCNFCSTMKPVFIALASISAVIIFLGTFRL